jgi:HipA-like protein
MRKAKVLFKDEEAGVLEQHDDGTFMFQYGSAWLNDGSKPAISLTMPKTATAYHSEFLFPFFYNMLPEGSNKEVVCKINRIDQNDYFGLLLTTANDDTIGAVRVVKIEDR